MSFIYFYLFSNSLPENNTPEKNVTYELSAPESGEETLSGETEGDEVQEGARYKEEGSDEPDEGFWDF